MTKTQKSIRNMYQVVINILTSFIASWTTYLPFATVVTEYKDDVNEIDDTATAQAALLKGYTTNKRVKKRDMAEKGSTIARKVSGFAADTGNFILLKAMKISFSKLFYSAATTSANFAQAIYDAASAMTAPERVTYNITDPDLADLLDAITTFRNLPSPRQMVVIRKQLTTDLAQMFTDTSLVLSDRMDNLMSNFKLSDPEFYEQYFNARRLVEAHFHTTVEGTAIDETTGADLQNVQVLIVSSTESFEEMTDSQGKFAKQITPEINYKVKFILPEYEEQEFDNINLNRGEHDKLLVIMKKIV
jgi:hypothetical protein